MKARRWLRRVLALAAIGVLGVCGVVALLWLEHRTTLTLQARSGPFPVSRVEEVWTDTDESETKPPRELLVWFWFPGQASSDNRVAYLPPEWRQELARRQASDDYSREHPPGFMHIASPTPN